MPTDPFAEHEDDQRGLELLLLALFLALSKMPPRLQRPRGRRIATRRLIRTRDAPAITGSTWWASVFRDFETKLATLLAEISTGAGSFAIRELSARLGAGLAGDLAADAARIHARDLVRRLGDSIAAGLPQTLADLRRLGAEEDILRALKARLGPTAAQLGQIRRWERAAVQRGESRRAVRRKVRRWARKARARRAQAFAGHAMALELNETRSAVFAAVGVRIFSWNPLDSRTDEQHARQTRTTRENPTPAGTPWTALAPFRHLPPYPHKGRFTGRCRCHVRRASR